MTADPCNPSHLSSTASHLGTSPSDVVICNLQRQRSNRCRLRKLVATDIVHKASWGRRSVSTAGLVCLGYVSPFIFEINANSQRIETSSILSEDDGLSAFAILRDALSQSKNLLISLAVQKPASATSRMPRRSSSRRFFALPAARRA